MYSQASRAVAAPGRVVLTLVPSAAGRRALLQRGKRGLPVKLAVTFTPTGGTASTHTSKLMVRTKARVKRPHNHKGH